MYILYYKERVFSSQILDNAECGIRNTEYGINGGALCALILSIKEPSPDWGGVEGGW